MRHKEHRDQGGEGLNSNLTSDGVNSYTSYDRANRLLQVTDGTNTTTYGYDGLGNRISQDVNGLLTRYLLDLQPGLTQVIAAATGASTDRYVHGLHGIHAMKNNSGQWVWPTQDGLGNVRQEVSDALKVNGIRSYEPYLTPFDEQGNFGMPFAATGEMVDVTGLMYLRNRYMNPAIGQFVSLDPFEGIPDHAMSLNGYSWVEGNTPNWTDPFGLQGGEAAGVAGICVICPECCIAGVLIVGWWLILNLLKNRTRTRTDDTTGSQFPCTRAGGNSLGEYAPFGYSSPNTLGQWSIFDGDALGDLRCHLRHYNGIEYDSLFQLLSNSPSMVGFEMRPSSDGYPVFNYNVPYSRGMGTIYIPQPADGKYQGTRADRVAAFVEEIVHAAQFHNKIPGGSCTMSWYDSELQAVSLRVAWMLKSGINPASFRLNGPWLTVAQSGQLAQNVLSTYTNQANGANIKNLPAFPYQRPSTGEIDWTQSACPLGNGDGIVPVPFNSSAGNVGNILRGLQNAPMIITTIGCVN